MGRKTYTRSSRSAVGALALCLSPVVALHAQYDHTGDGFLFGKPTGTMTLRLGYDLANASSDVYSVQRRDLTIGSRGFDGLAYGVDFAFPTTRRVDLGFTVDGNTRSHGSEYRAWEDNNNQPITQRTTMTLYAVSANFRYNFYDRGREISSLAWIPANTLPYVGLGGGFQYYELDQKGDFIDMSSINKDVVHDELHSDGWGGLGQAFVGVQRNLSATVAFTTEARYTLSNANLNQDYSDLGRINLSGLSFTLGTTIRF